MISPFTRTRAKPDCLKPVEEFFIRACSSLNEGRHDLDLGCGRDFQNLVDDLLGGLRLDLTSAFGAMRLSHAGIEQSKVIVNLGDGGDR